MKRFLMSEDGQGMVEYGLIIALVAVAVIVAVKLLAPAISDIFTTASNELTGASES